MSMDLFSICFVFSYNISKSTLNDENMVIFLEIKMMLHNQNRIGGLSHPVQCIIITGMTFIADNQGNIAELAVEIFNTDVTAKCHTLWHLCVIKYISIYEIIIRNFKKRLMVCHWVSHIFFNYYVARVL